MIVYFAGNSLKLEDAEHLKQKKSKLWGVLMSYKDLRNKSGNGSPRFRRIMESQKEK